MPGPKHTPEQIVRKLRTAEVELAKGLSVKAVCKQLGVTDHTYYRWRKEYGGMQVDQARRLKELERENARLKRQHTQTPQNEGTARTAVHIARDHGVSRAIVERALAITD